MREIKFRGKRVDNGKWIYGNLIIDEGKYYICLGINEHIKRDDYEVYMIEVIPETVGQYVGIEDKTKTEIFEGDILKDKWNTIYVVKYRNTGFYIYRNNGRNGYSKIASWNGDKEVIGNIHDNPEMLKEVWNASNRGRF